MNKRYLDNGISNYQYYLSDQYVICPQCNKYSILKYQPCVHQTQYLTEGEFSFTCQHCLYHLDSSNPNIKNGNYYIRADGRCQKCGGQWLHAEEKIVNSGSLPQFIEKTCTYCNFPTQFKEYSIHFKYNDQIGYTKFGLELYLKTSTRCGDVFVYNVLHLIELKSFIKANLRERNPNTGNSSYFSRLPVWIKSARNRKEILKAILRLEQMASNIQPLTKKRKQT